MDRTLELSDEKTETFANRENREATAEKSPNLTPPCQTPQASKRRMEGRGQGKNLTELMDSLDPSRGLLFIYFIRDNSSERPAVGYLQYKLRFQRHM